MRFVEYFLIETDQTAIGFQRNGFAGSILKGLLLGSVCFIISYGLELAILALQGNPVYLEI